MESNNDLSFRGTLSLKDFQKFQFYHMRKFYILYFWFVVFLASLAMTILYPGSWLSSLLFSLAISILGMGLLAILYRFRFKREYASDALMQREIQYRLTEAGIRQSTKSTNAHFDWKNIRAAHKNKGIYRLYVSRSKALIIPERFFASEEDKREFEKIVSSHLPASSNELDISSSARPLWVLFLGAGTLVIGLIFAVSFLLTELIAPSQTNSSSSWPITTTVLHEEIQDSGKIEDEEEDGYVESFNQHSKEMGSFIFASRESPDKAHMIELREVVLEDENYKPRLGDDEQNNVVVRIYFGENGGILEDFVQYDPKGMFTLEDFEVNWTSDNQATVNAFVENIDGEKVLDESFEIIIED